MLSTRTIGKIYEQYAQTFLIQKGLILLQKNFHCRLGEIDLIMQDQKTLVFVEVRYRTHRQYGTAESTITYKKRNKLIYTAQYFLLTHREYKQFHSRFDVIAIESSQKNPKIKWIPRAFTVQ